MRFLDSISERGDMKRLLFLCLMGISLTVAAAADFTEIPYAYLPLTEKELGEPFPLQWVGDIDHNQSPKPLTIQAGHAKGLLNWQDETEQHPEQPLTLTGKDLAGKPWQVAIAQMRGCAPTRIYHADLDKNGLEDVIVVRRTCGNGLAMPTLIYLITFEANGRPLLLTLNSYFDDEGRKLAALRDLNQDGKAELLDMTFVSGYWASHVYQLHNAHWQRVQGQFSARHYPLFTRFTKQPNRQPVNPAQPQAVRDLSNDTPSFAGKLRAFTPSLEDEQISSIKLTLTTPQAQKTCTLTDAWVITQDRPSGRTIDTEASTSNILLRLEKLAKTGKANAAFFGQADGVGCRPFAVRINYEKLP
jgi:hypothetical protein